MKIAILDYRVVSTNPAGGCHLRMLRELCHEHEFTVFAVEFDNPCAERIRFLRVPAPRRPLALLFVVYHALAPVYYLAHRLRHRVRFDVVQGIESNVAFADVVYAHFCHRFYLGRYWRKVGTGGLRGAVRWLDHWLHARLEPRVYRNARRVVVPSSGLARELSAEWPSVSPKVTIIANPVDLDRFRPPSAEDRDGVRKRLGLEPDDVVLVFVALGHFERKGLPLLLEALRRAADRRLKLLVVGGRAGLLAVYRARADRMHLGDRVAFAGMQDDVRPYLWAVDLFVLPSMYEVFPLVSLEAAAAGLPLVVTPLNGVEEFLRDGVNGFLVEPTAEGVREGLSRFLARDPAGRRAMGEQARRDVQRYGADRFVAAWRAFYEAGHGS